MDLHAINVEELSLVFIRLFNSLIFEHLKGWVVPEPVYLLKIRVAFSPYCEPLLMVSGSCLMIPFHCSATLSFSPLFSCIFIFPSHLCFFQHPVFTEICAKLGLSVINFRAVSEVWRFE